MLLLVLVTPKKDFFVVVVSLSSPTLKLLALKGSTLASEDEQDEQDCTQYYDAFSEAKERIIHLF